MMGRLTSNPAGDERPRIEENDSIGASLGRECYSQVPLAERHPPWANAREGGGFATPRAPWVASSAASRVRPRGRLRLEQELRQHRVQCSRWCATACSRCRSACSRGGPSVRYSSRFFEVAFAERAAGRSRRSGSSSSPSNFVIPENGKSSSSSSRTWKTITSCRWWRSISSPLNSGSRSQSRSEKIEHQPAGGHALGHPPHDLQDVGLPRRGFGRCGAASRHRVHGASASCSGHHLRTSESKAIELPHGVSAA